MASADGTERAAAEKYDLLIAFRYINYMEGWNRIEFQVDPGLKTPSVIHIPSPDRWDSELPEWARGRRDGILARVRGKTSHMNREFNGY